MNRRHLPLIATILVFLLVYALCTAQYPKMLSFRVVGNLLTDNAFLGIVAVGMTFVIISGGIDLSVGAVIAFATVFLAIAIGSWGMPPLLAFGLVILIAVLFGAAMGAVIHFLKTPPFIVTLAGMFLARGACFLLTTDSIPVDHEIYTALNSFYVKLPHGGRLSFIAMIMLGVVAAGIVLLHFTRFGANVFALGGNSLAAQMMGVRSGRSTILVYALSAGLSGLAGIVFSLYTSAGYSLAAIGVELDTIAAVVIGGTLLSGGQGFVLGTFVGVLIQGLIQTYITFDGTLSSWWTKIVVGLLLFAFILLHRILVYLSARRAAGARGSK
ncbi:galactofuranose ABC transporter, permease protein YjfF [Dongia sp.]|uniref:galactofuranose ABC transporter, permease protein YjfF n=1 Tax=Dongia sp. TaxID=1977262 RepID=UPI0035B1A2C6